MLDLQNLLQMLFQKNAKLSVFKTVSLQTYLLYYTVCKHVILWESFFVGFDLDSHNE